MADVDVHLMQDGKIVETNVDWDGDLEQEPDDDEEMDETPEDVIAILGFDPKIWSKGE